jgi:hypothetical protein
MRPLFVTKSFAHLELHSQNVDVLVSSKGKVRGVYIKDLLDMMHDPAAQAAKGKLPRGVQALRDKEWGNLGESNAQYNVANFYSTYLGQLTLPGANYSSRGTGFHAMVRDELRKIFGRRKDVGRLKRYPEYAKAIDPNNNLWVTTENLRNLLVKANLEKSFKPDASAQRRFKDAPGGLAGPTGRNPSPDLSAMEYGYVGKKPVAVKRGADGTIQDYYFKFR